MKKTGLILTFLFCVVIAGQAQTITPKARKVQLYMPDNAVIAHRGSVYWTPETTEAGYRWARNIGSDYMEMDVQRSKDGVLILMHDRTFKRTTDVALKFPGRENDSIDDFTLDEIMQLETGTVFNKNSPEHARKSFVGQGVLVFEDIFRIAEGKRIKRNSSGTRLFHKNTAGKYVFEYEQDPADNGNRPGVYIETKDPELYPGIEEQLYAELTGMGWNPLEGVKIKENEPFYLNGKVNVGNTMGKILLQSFSRPGMKNIKRIFKEEVLTSFLIGNTKANEFSKGEVMDEIISFAVNEGAQFIGTNLGEANDGLTPEFAQKIHTTGMKTNVYSFNTREQMVKYFGPGAGKKASPLSDGMITNRADLTIDFYYEKSLRKSKTTQAPDEILNALGYKL